MMKYKIGDKVIFNHDVYDYYYNTDIVYIGTVTASGTIEQISEDKNLYTIVTDKGIQYMVDENEIVYSERGKKIKELEEKITEQKIKIADCSIKMRDALWGADHPAHYKECSAEYDRLNEEWYDLISEYDELEDVYITLTKEQ